jgi:transcriptional regulator with XRE-family HTH domain
VARKPKTGRARPAQGSRLLALRRAAGLTQIDLAEALGVAQANIAQWEWSDKPPRAELLLELANILGVTTEELLSGTSTKRKAGAPVGEVQRAFEEVRKLPRKQQKKIIETVNALVNEYHRQAG